MKKYFHGGIHPSDGSDKILSNQVPIRMYTPQSVEISMKQSPNGFCNAVVKVGDNVSKGDLIGIPRGFGAANIHASIGGTVTDIIKTKDNQGREFETVVIRSEENENAAKDLPDKEYEKKIVDITSFSRDEIIKKMDEGGLIGMGGAGFPTHIKYETKDEINYILINGAECEPYLTCDHMLMKEHGYAIINGVHLFIKAANAKKAYICIEDNKQDVAHELKKIISGKELPIEILILPTRYPQGGERQLTEAVLRKEVPAGSLPSAVGTIINNVGTAKALADIVLGGEPVISRVVTVTGKVKNPCNYLVPIGTRYSELIQESGGFTAEICRVIEGGPMTGNCIMIGKEPEKIMGSVAKNTSGLLVLEDFEKTESPCIRCGECERVCPAGLAPYKIDFAEIEGDINLCEKLYATECISCGSCSYVCPAKRELAYRITKAKNEIFRIRRERSGK